MQINRIKTHKDPTGFWKQMQRNIVCLLVCVFLFTPQTIRASIRCPLIWSFIPFKIAKYYNYGDADTFT